MENINPESVWDIGGNIGEFSRLASERGIATITFDIDPLAVEKNYQLVMKNNERNILPLILDLTNPSPSIGWANNERKSITERSPVDMVMALALIHHLSISNNVPLDMTASYLNSLTKHGLIIEFVPKTDSQVKRLLASREDIFDDYTQENFEEVFTKYFIKQKAIQVKGSDRTVYLYTKR